MTIETERLVLRPFTEADAEDVFEYLQTGCKLLCMYEA